MIPILCGLVILLLIGGIAFCAVIGGYQQPEDWWGEGISPEKVPRLQRP